MGLTGSKALGRIPGGSKCRYAPMTTRVFFHLGQLGQTFWPCFFLVGVPEIDRIRKKTVPKASTSGGHCISNMLT